MRKQEAKAIIIVEMLQGNYVSLEIYFQLSLYFSNQVLIYKVYFNAFLCRSLKQYEKILKIKVKYLKPSPSRSILSAR